jgi:hypothetical protein
LVAMTRAIVPASLVYKSLGGYVETVVTFALQRESLLLRCDLSDRSLPEDEVRPFVRVDEMARVDLFVGMVRFTPPPLLILSDGRQKVQIACLLASTKHKKTPGKAGG